MYADILNLASFIVQRDLWFFSLQNSILVEAVVANGILVTETRVQASIAEAAVRWNCLPDKMNPVVRPLMDALRREENVELQVVTSLSLM